MRTTILLNDELAEQMRARAREKGQSLSAFLAEAGRAALGLEASIPEKPFELITYGESGVMPGIDLDQTSALLAAEDKGKYGR